MIEALKTFLTHADFSEKQPTLLKREIEMIANSESLKNQFRKEQIETYFQTTYDLVKKHIDLQQESTSLTRTVTKFEEDFQQDFDQYFQELGGQTINKETLLILLEQICLSKLERIHLSKVTSRYESLVFQLYCLKQEKLENAASRFDANMKTEGLFETLKNQLKKEEEKEYKFLQDMRGMKSYIDSDEFINKQFQLYTSDHIRSIEKGSNPILPNFFINFNLTESLNGLQQVDFKKRNEPVKEFIKTEKESIKNESQMLESVRGVKDVQTTPYRPISLISNSRANHCLFLQKLLGSQRPIATSHTDENKIYEGDFIGFLDRKEKKRIMILTTPGLDDSASLQKMESEIGQVQNLKMNVKDFSKKSGDMKQYSKELKEMSKSKEEVIQFMSIIQLIKKSIVTQFLIETTETVFVILQDIDQDFTLYQQIKLICHSFLKNKDNSKNINFIHFYPEISDVRSTAAERQYKKIQKRYNLTDSGSDFQNESFMIFKEKEERGSSISQRQKESNTKFYHYMLFGDFESKYNQQLFSHINEEIDNSDSSEIIPNKIEDNIKSHICNCIDIFFEDSEGCLQFKEPPPQKKKKIEEDQSEYPQFQNETPFLDWKDLVLYPYCFLTPNPIDQQEEENNNE